MVKCNLLGGRKNWDFLKPKLEISPPPLRLISSPYIEWITSWIYLLNISDVLCLPAEVLLASTSSIHYLSTSQHSALLQFWNNPNPTCARINLESRAFNAVWWTQILLSTIEITSLPLKWHTFNIALITVMKMCIQHYKRIWIN